MKTRSWLKALAMAYGCMGFALTAFGHASPVQYVPNAAAMLASAPKELDIHFSEHLEPHASFVTIITPDGVTHHETVAVDTTDRKLLRTPFSFTASGTYAISWSVMSADDGHFTKGAYPLSIRLQSKNTLQTGVSITHRLGFLEGGIVGWEMLGMSVVLGCVLLSMLLGATPEIRKRLRMLWRIAICASFLSLVAFVYFQGFLFAQETGRTLAESFGIMLGTVAVHSAFQRGLLLLFLVAALRTWDMNEDKYMRSAGWSIVALLVLDAVLRAAVSHAAATAWPALSIGITALHLLAKAAWIGSVLAFAWAYLPVLHAQPSVPPLIRGRLLLSRFLSWCLLIGGLSGIFVVWSDLKSLDNLKTTHWGMHLIALILFAILLLIMRWSQQYIIEPAAVRLAQGRGRKDDSETVTSSWIQMSFEALTGIAIFWLSGVLLTTTPPLAQPSLFSVTQHSGDAVITLERAPYDAHAFVLSMKPHTVSGVIVSLRNNTQNVGPILAPVQHIFSGGYVLRDTNFAPNGQWTVDVVFSRPHAYDAVAHFTLSLPHDLAPTPSAFWNPFTQALALLATLIVLAFLFMHHTSTRLLRSLPVDTHHPPTNLHFTSRQAFVAIGFGTVMLVFFGSMAESHAHGIFQAHCLADRNAWEENVPEKDGVILSDEAILGCTINTGTHQTHLTDAREYEFRRHKS